MEHGNHKCALAAQLFLHLIFAFDYCFVQALCLALSSISRTRAMTTRLRIAARIFPELVLHDIDLAIAKPEVFAHRALLLAEALLQCEEMLASKAFHSGTPDRDIATRLARRRKLLLPSQEMLRSAPGASRH